MTYLLFMSIESLKSRTDLSVDEIDQLMNKENDVKRYKKLGFIKLIKKGYSIKEAYNLANMKKSSAYLTLDQWNEGGYNAFVRKSGSGRNIKLNQNQLLELKKNISSKNLTSEKDVQKYIKNKWNEEYTLPGIRNLLKSQLDVNLNEKKNTIKELTTKLHNILKIAEDNNIYEDTEITKLKFLISREQNADVLKKLMYILLRRIGFANKFITSLLSVTTATGNNWIRKWENVGYEGLKRKKGQGRKCKLNEEQIDILKKN